MPAYGCGNLHILNEVLHDVVAFVGLVFHQTMNEWMNEWMNESFIYPEKKVILHIYKNEKSINRA